MCARQVYYIFSKADDAARFCAVRQDQPIPAFLDGVAWTFVRSLNVPTDKLSGFDLDAAEDATRQARAYLYERTLPFAAALRELAAA